MREVYKALDVEWCALMDGSGKNLMLQSIVESIQASVPQLFHECPYTPNWYNVSMFVDPDTFYSLMPSGLYKFAYNYTTPNGVLMSTSCTAEVKSEIRTSF
jgi:hypothetical protein